MKRKVTKTTCVSTAGFENAERSPLTMSPTVPIQVPPRISQTTVTMVPKTSANRNFLRQYQARRRLMMSSSRNCWLSAPKRLGHGISRRKRRSTKPRKAITIPRVATSDQSVLQPLYWCSQTKSAGLVRTATKVAARVSRRHWSASSFPPAASEGKRASGSATATGPSRRPPLAECRPRRRTVCYCEVKPRRGFATVAI